LNDRILLLMRLKRVQITAPFLYCVTLADRLVSFLVSLC